MIFSSPVPQKACTSSPPGSRCMLFAGQVMKISYPPVVQRVITTYLSEYVLFKNIRCNLCEGTGICNSSGLLNYFYFHQNKNILIACFWQTKHCTVMFDATNCIQSYILNNSWPNFDFKAFFFSELKKLPLSPKN